MKKNILYVILLGIILLGVVGCSKSSSKGSEDVGQVNIDRIKEKGELVLATSADYPPFEWHLNEDGKDTVVGFDIAIAQSIADELGVELVIKDLDFDAIIPSLVSGQSDIAIAGLVPTPERQEVVEFSKPYYENEQIVVVHKDNADKYKKIEDFAGKKIGAQTGSTQEIIAQEQFPDDIDILSLSKLNNLIMEVKNKTAEGVIMIDNSAEQYLVQNKDLVILDVGIPPEEGNCIAIGKDKKDLLKLVDQHLQKLKDQGKIDEFVQKYTELASQSQVMD